MDLAAHFFGGDMTLNLALEIYEEAMKGFFEEQSLSLSVAEQDQDDRFVETLFIEAD